MTLMSRALLFIFAIFASILLVLGSPIPTNGSEIDVELEKRITHTGRGTWFNVGLGNCGKRNKDSDLIVAISKSLYDRNRGSNCGQYVKITNKANGKVAYGATEDSCPSCGEGDLDLSPALFKKLASLDQGVIQISWNFKTQGWKP